MFKGLFRNRDLHEHGPVIANGWKIGIDSAVQRLWDRKDNMLIAIQKQNESIKKLQAEIETIHVSWRNNLCCNCKHSAVCKITQSVRYGDGCADHMAEDV